MPTNQLIVEEQKDTSSFRFLLFLGLILCCVWDLVVDTSTETDYQRGYKDGIIATTNGKAGVMKSPTGETIVYGIPSANKVK